MKLIVDTNIVFSAILKPSGPISSLFINNTDVVLISCDYLKEEIDEHKDRLIRLTGYTDNILEKVKETIFDKIHFYALAIIPDSILLEAKSLTKDIDPDDYPFIAFALFFNCKLWSGDKVLAEGLKAKGYNLTLTTPDVAIAIMK